MDGRRGMRVEQVAARRKLPPDRLVDFGHRRAAGVEFGPDAWPVRCLDGEGARLLEPIHVAADRGGIALRAPRTAAARNSTTPGCPSTAKSSRRRLACLVFAGLERAGEDVVVVGGDDQPIDRQAHALGRIAGEDVAEIAGRNGEGDRPVRAAQRNRRGEVIDDLGHDARPVDRIDARQRHAVAKGVVVEHFLHQPLAVVEIALDGQRMDVRCGRRRHLPLLHRRHAPVREQDEDVGAVAAGEGLDRGAAGVARRCAGDGRARSALGKHMVHQPRQKLHGHVLEGQRRAVEQLEDEAVRADLHQRAYRLMAKRRVGLAHHPLETGRLDLAAEERRKHADGEVRIGKPAHGADFGGGKLRPLPRDVEPAVAGKPGQNRIRKTENGRFAPRTHILHRHLSVAAA